MSDPTPRAGSDPDRRAAGAQLIRDAFQQARESGKADWRDMRSAVLKNRILSLNADFDERDWGAERFSGFLQQYPDLVTVDATQTPALVRFLEEGGEGPRGSDAPVPAWSGRRHRIRGDLWEAVMDVDSPIPYYWDGAAAVRIRDADAGQFPKLPTVTPEDLLAWRAEFIAQLRDSAPGQVPEARLQEWHDRALNSRALPHPFRARWIGDLKRQVQERLEAWFAENGIDPPADLVIEYTPGGSEDPETERLRRLIVRAIEGMTRAELEDLMLPARAMFRGRS